MSAVLVAEAPVIQRVEPNPNRLSARKVSVPNPEQVRNYLAANPEFVEITEQVCELAATEFSGDAELSLELYSDPEIDDRYLTLYVQRASDEQSAWDKIGRIRESCENELAELPGWLHITLDFRA
jgi:hypothetical protein